MIGIILYLSNNLLLLLHQNKHTMKASKKIIIIVGIWVAFLAVTNNQTQTRKLRNFQFRSTTEQIIKFNTTK